MYFNLDEKYVNELELNDFKKDLMRIETQELDIIYDILFDRVCERKLYDKFINMIEWECAICGNKIFLDKRRNDVDNFVCDSCRELYNNNNDIIDKRILLSRNKMYEELENRLYDELENNLFSLKIE